MAEFHAFHREFPASFTRNWQIADSGNCLYDCRLVLSILNKHCFPGGSPGPHCRLRLMPSSRFTPELSVNYQIMDGGEEKQNTPSNKTTGGKGLGENEPEEDTCQNQNACNRDKGVHCINVGEGEPMRTNKNCKRREKDILLARFGGHEDER